MSRGWKGGSTRAWRRVRRQVLERDGYRCQLKLDVCTTRATTAHHVKGKAMGDDPRFLVAACQPCNLKVGDPTKHDPAPLPWGGW
ncbi:MAG TPA: HNH endonuclease signature motif containing protein [Actinomycetes bacterium]|nr:HNH endonuclease signature motif containing protein [Actinomycetes bacterium]